MNHKERLQWEGMSMPRQLTIRMADKELERAIVDLARSEGISLNRAALRILRRGAGLSAHREEGNTVGNTLDALGGTWSEAEAQEFEQAVGHFEKLDEDLWT